ncbi:GFA family protein [Rhodovulum sp. 12E13]|uniref:GFA family protein n=1 Tax=Rhodovulum sp. 12E13 TaxID=2203891 RepID=UPI0013147292|nr:GFA family protein [Rhodovulum sp. 12E13]
MAWRASASPFRSVLCHCADCRRLTGASPVGYLGFPKPVVRWEARRAFRATSAGVTRGACPACGTLLSYMCTIWPGELYLHAATLDDPEGFVPETHLHRAVREVEGTGKGDGSSPHEGSGPAASPRDRP